MKLLEIHNSAGAWRTLAALKKNPKLAYRLLKYEKKVDAELAVCEQQRSAFIYEAAGVEPPEPGEQKIVQIGAETPEFAAFMAKFNEFLQGESDLAWIGIGMDELIDGLGSATNVLTERELELLEPFFTEPKVEAV